MSNQNHNCSHLDTRPNTKQVLARIGGVFICDGEHVCRGVLMSNAMCTCVLSVCGLSVIVPERQDWSKGSVAVPTSSWAVTYVPFATSPRLVAGLLKRWLQKVLSVFRFSLLT